MKIYCNGQPVAENTAASRTMVDVGNLVIGAKSTSEGFYDGKLDDLRIYNRALSNSDINYIYQQGL